LQDEKSSILQNERMAEEVDNAFNVETFFNDLMTKARDLPALFCGEVMDLIHNDDL